MNNQFVIFSSRQESDLRILPMIVRCIVESGRHFLIPRIVFSAPLVWSGVLNSTYLCWPGIIWVTFALIHPLISWLCHGCKCIVSTMHFLLHYFRFVVKVNLKVNCWVHTDVLNRCITLACYFSVCYCSLFYIFY